MIRRCLKWSGRQLCSGTLLRQSGWEITAEVADGTLAQLGSPRSTLFRAVARLRRTRRASNLLPLKRGTRDRSSLLDPRIERIVKEPIERFWLKKEKPRFSGLMERVHDACHARVCGRRIEKQSIAASWI
jgi:putative transposase